MFCGAVAFRWVAVVCGGGICCLCCFGGCGVPWVGVFRCFSVFYGSLCSAGYLLLVMVFCGVWYTVGGCVLSTVVHCKL